MGGASSVSGGLWAIAALTLAAWPLTKLSTAASGPPPQGEVPTTAESAPRPATPEVDDYCGERFASPFQRRSGASAKAVPSIEQSLVQLTSKKTKETWSLALPGEHGSTPSWSDRLEASRRAICAVEPATEFESFVGLVPDPAESGLTYAFHTHLHGLQTGMEAADGPETLIRDESWLAWDDRRVAADARKTSEDCRYTTPSVIMFRRAAAPTLVHGANHLKLVFLVGDNPVTGPHRAALDRALTAAATFSGGCATRPDRPTLRVLGPAFSGGAPTLRAALQKALWAFRSIEIVTGTASAREVPFFFDNVALPTFDHATGPSTAAVPPTSISFARSTAAEPDLMCALHEYVESALLPGNEGALEPRVALLREGGTAFGVSLQTVDTKDGADTSTGAAACTQRKLLNIQFPIGIAAIREEYEELDQRSGGDTAPVARRTSLNLTMRDERRALNFEADPSDRTNDARDLALAKALSAISSMQIQYAAIQATDVADAMFVARKIRDVAPNVRIVFLEANTLLTHPSYRGDLLGSLVVSPYPMLAASPLASPTDDLGVYESDSALGVHNAMAYLRSRSQLGLREYTLLGPHHPLPVWVSAIGRSGFVPVRLYERTTGGALGDSISNEETPGPAPLFAHAGGMEFPRLWQFTFLCLVCLAILDWVGQAREQMQLEMDKGCGGPDSPEKLKYGRSDHSDHDWDLAAIRVKALGQQAIRSTILFGALLYMSFTSWMASDLFGFDLWWTLKLSAAGVVVLVASVSAALRICQLLREIPSFVRHDPTLRRVSKVPPAPATQDGNDESSAAKSLRAKVVAGLWQGAALSGVAFLAIGFVAALHLSEHLSSSATFESKAQASVASSDPLIEQHRTLFVLREMDLTSGVSPFAPLVFAALCVYMFAFGRTSRLLTAYALANVAPPDGVSDGVSTPLAAILYPVIGKPASDTPWMLRRKGLLDDEVHLVNAVAHPNTESRRRLFGVLIVACPILFTFFLKRPSAIGSWRETAFLFIVLTVCASLTLLVLLYLWEYWRALERVLKRIMEHPIGHSMSRTHPFARDALPDMVSRDPDETLRLAACAQLGSTLLQTCPVPTLIAIYGLDGKSERLDALRARALKRPSDEWSTGWGIKELAERHRTLTWPRDRLFKPALAFLRSTTVAVQSQLGALISSTPSASKGSSPSVEANQAPIPRQAIAPPSDTLLSTVHATESSHASASAGGGVWDTAEPPRVGTLSLAPGKHSVETVADLGTDVLTLACLGMGVLEKSWGEEDQTPHPRPASDLKPQAKHGAWAATHMLYAKHELVWLRDLETYVATVIALVIGRYVRQFKHFVYASTLCCVLLLLAVSSYSFEPRRVLMTCIWLLMAAVVSLTLLVYIGLDRNTLLSHISGSSPNRVTLSSAVLWRGMVWVVFPVLGVVAAQYPDLVNAVYGMFEPLVRTMH